MVLINPSADESSQNLQILYCKIFKLLDFAVRCLLNSFSGFSYNFLVLVGYKCVATFKAASFILQSCDNHLPSLDSADWFQTASGVFLNFSH